ncbi:MAG: DEAD/DEAH box helicase, partial [Alphaproteobacteria bacterium]|nr:DEAD/DEAH box helicase [Alphaproteobacteria bacterium]
DVAARGLDLPNLDLVIHADIPRTSDTLLHRSGRTGRAGRKGVCAVLVPQNRSRMAERLFSQANIKPVWASTPSREEILKEDKKRIVENQILKDPITDDEKDLIDELISKNSIEQLAAAYYRLLGKDLSAPEDLRNPSDRDEGRGRDNGFKNSIWFELSVGRDDTAEPRWLVAMLCKAGNLSKRDIGSIKIQPKVTNIEISEETAATLKELASNKKPIERHIMIRLLDKPPEGAGSDRGRSERNRPNRGRSDFKRSGEGRSRDFKKGDFQGKGKSERWRSSDRKKPKFSPFADNYIEKDVVESADQGNTKPSSRRGKQKQDFGRSDRNHNKDDFRSRDKNKRNSSKSKKEKKPNLEGRFNKDDKKKTPGKAVKTDTLSIPTKDTTGKLKSENKVKKGKKSKS